jgi:2-keto-4-pentenoate hydratase/2-oxohepta-3-ene-1,7-dioic acid hydratase in catechol pathway
VPFVALAGGVGRLEDDGTVAVLDIPHPGLAEVLTDCGSRSSLDRAGVRARIPLGERLATPVGPSSSIWGIGLNYRSKQEATGRALPEEPTIFLKAVGALGDNRITLPVLAPREVDYEGEIAVMIQDFLFESPPRVAASAVGAVFAANDVTARDVMRRTGSPLLAKSFPGFGQFGSVVAEPDGHGDLAAVAVRTLVNGEVRQDDRGGGMILEVGELLSYISRFSVLRPGDVILTGTPAGTGDETGRYLRGGDVVEVTVGDLPPLSSAVVEEPRDTKGSEE